MKVLRISPSINEYSRYGVNNQSQRVSVPLRKPLDRDVFEFSTISKKKPSFSGLPFKNLVTSLASVTKSNAAEDVAQSMDPSKWIDTSLQSRIQALGQDVKDTFTGLFGAKLKGKKQLKIGDKLFDMQRRENGAPFFVQRNGNLEISVSQVEGKRLYSVVDNKTKAKLVQDGACSYKMAVPDGEYLTTIDTNYTRNNANNITFSLSTTRDAAGQIVEVAEKGNNGHEYVYNLVNNKYAYRELDGERPFQRVYDTVVLNPEDVAYSQGFVNEAGFIKLRNSMENEGWTREPIHVIRMQDGQLVSLDNRRLRAATETNTPIRAIIHDVDEDLSPLFSTRHQICNPETDEVIAKPKTWGEIVFNRLMQNGFVEDGSIRYSKEPPVFGDNFFLKEGSTRLIDAYMSGRPPIMAYRA